MKDIKSLNNNFPWLVFSLNSSYFALNCENITTITILPKKIIQPVLTPPYIRGLLDLRGDVIPLVNMRSLFEFPSAESERAEIVEVLEKGMNAHRNWINELDKTIKTGEEFKLSLDPHKCDFGKWYDSYQSKYYIVNSHLKKINQPHIDLHENGAKIVNLVKQPRTQEVEDQIQKYYAEIRNEFMPDILATVKDIQEDWVDAQKEMVIVFQYSDRKIGLIVDEVRSVEHLEILPQEVSLDMQSIAHFFSCIARSPRTNDVIFLVDESELGILFSQPDFDVNSLSTTPTTEGLTGTK